MMTFLPLEDFLQSALSLDDKRLQNQRTEARFVLEWLEGRGFELEAYGAARMWRGYRDALAAYYNACLEAYEARGKTNGPTMPRAAVPKRWERPPWLGAGQQKRAKFPTSKAHISAGFHSFRLIFGRAIISRNGLEAWMLFLERARAEHSR